jgi:hypothetical protein
MDFKAFISSILLLACLSILPLNGLLAEEGIPSTRSNPEDFEAAEQLSDPKAVLKGVPAFSVDDRTPFLESLDYYPCTDCHGEDQPPNPKVRTLEEEHDTVKLVHGAGRFWCLTCHDTQNRDNLVSLKNQKITFTDSYLLCGQCHFQRQKDFFYGAHGKRKESWRDEKKLTNCTECHNPHVPQIKKRPPVATPKVRTGLKPMKTVKHASEKPWSKSH